MVLIKLLKTMTDMSELITIKRDNYFYLEH